MPMRFQNIDYQARAPNRLARRARRHGFKTTQAGYNMRSTL